MEHEGVKRVEYADIIMSAQGNLVYVGDTHHPLIIL